MAHFTVIVLVALATTFQLIGAANAQTPPAPRPSTPEGTRPTPPAPASSEIGARPLTIDECIAIALEGQPTIQERLAAYAAARYRVNQAFAPLLPQLSAQVGAARVRSTSSGGQPQDSQFADTFAAQLLLSQLLFDFGKNLAETEGRRKLAEVEVENVELQRQLISATVKEAYTNTLFSQRLIRVQEQAQERAELNLRSAKGFFEVGTRPKSDVARAEVDVANAKLDHIRAKNALRSAIVAL